MPTPIGFLRHNFLARSETFIYNSMRALEDHGEHHVRVFAVKRFLADRFPWDDVTLLRGPARVWYHVTRSAPGFVEWARSVKLIHAHLGQTGPFAMAGAARANVPFVVSYYGHDVMLDGEIAVRELVAKGNDPPAVRDQARFLDGDLFQSLQRFADDLELAFGRRRRNIKSDV